MDRKTVFFYPQIKIDYIPINSYLILKIDSNNKKEYIFFFVLSYFILFQYWNKIKIDL